MPRVQNILYIMMMILIITTISYFGGSLVLWMTDGHDISMKFGKMSMVDGIPVRNVYFDAYWFDNPKNVELRADPEVYMARTLFEPVFAEHGDASHLQKKNKNGDPILFIHGRKTPPNMINGVLHDDDNDKSDEKNMHSLYTIEADAWKGYGSWCIQAMEIFNKEKQKWTLDGYVVILSLKDKYQHCKINRNSHIGKRLSAPYRESTAIIARSGYTQVGETYYDYEPPNKDDPDAWIFTDNAQRGDCGLKVELILRVQPIWKYYLYEWLYEWIMPSSSEHDVTANNSSSERMSVRPFHSRHTGMAVMGLSFMILMAVIKYIQSMGNAAIVPLDGVVIDYQSL